MVWFETRVFLTDSFDLVTITFLEMLLLFNFHWINSTRIWIRLQAKKRLKIILLHGRFSSSVMKRTSYIILVLVFKKYDLRLILNKNPVFFFFEIYTLIADVKSSNNSFPYRIKCCCVWILMMSVHLILSVEICVQGSSWTHHLLFWWC